MNHFEVHDWTTGLIAECDRAFPSRLHGVAHGARQVDAGGAWFGFVQEGTAHLYHNGRAYTLRAGDYFRTPGAFSIDAPAGRVLLLEREGVAPPPFTLGNDAGHWHAGRLKYIDGCTDTLLISPWKKGEACLNLLHFPPGIDQTMHTHPSDRIGVITSGRGRCVTPDGAFELRPGMLWRIPADGQHKFQTDADSGMQVIAYHPDSDHGPSDEEHPMLNRTIVGGVSARFLDEIRTK